MMPSTAVFPSLEQVMTLSTGSSSDIALLLWLIMTWLFYSILFSVFLPILHVIHTTGPLRFHVFMRSSVTFSSSGNLNPTSNPKPHILLSFASPWGCPWPWGHLTMRPPLTHPIETTGFSVTAAALSVCLFSNTSALSSEVLFRVSLAVWNLKAHFIYF